LEAVDLQTVNLARTAKTFEDDRTVILSGAKDLAPTPKAFFGAGARSFAALRTTGKALDKDVR